MGVFTDESNQSYTLYEGLRTKIKPGWQGMLAPKPSKISDAQLDNLKTNGNIAVENLKPLLQTLGKKIEGSTILEVGCHAGATSFAFAEANAKKVFGSEYTGYKVLSVDMKSGENETKLNEVSERLVGIRNRLAAKFSRSNHVEFVEDDICNSNLKPKSFDLICSWEVLEHLHDPEKAMKSMRHLLKDDGVIIHYYNPFFCLNGGHSLCTLDFLWGHARLSESDFVKYLDDIRPNEKDKALSFFKEGVNRMTLKDLENHIANSGLETVAIIPFTKEQHIRMVNQEILAQSQKNKANLQLLDLVAPAVLVVTRIAKD